eukprot:TRINITY_DN7818_c0_g1_i3.p1 TRINITY_DN7818_c0_g1~~TRINITY_DN7818_c0_g1_i3.p1  ORF type:complete len:862 (+),score=154.78 TRINITY_DN7818_c0_g1_i3:267-2588(+)
MELVRWEGDFENRRARPEGHNGERLILRHRFGDPSLASVEVVTASSAGPKAGYSATGSGQPPLPNGKAAGENVAADTSQPPPPNNKEAIEEKETKEASQEKDTMEEKETKEVKEDTADEENTPATAGLLGEIEVDPTVRATRLVSPDSSASFDQKYSLMPGVVLGTGMSGGVVVAKERGTDNEVAVKTLPLDTSVNMAQTKAEIQHQLAMDHPNICRLLEVYEEPGRLLMVMEKLDGKDLFEHLKSKGRYTETDAVDCIRQMCSAVAYCHAHAVCHRDLKLENFCMTDSSGDARIKMIDFGLSGAITSMPMTDACGTLYYVAPEVLSGHYDEKCDIWSLGVLAYVLLDGRAPFMGRNDRQTYKLIRTGSYSFPEDRWKNISEGAKDFVSKLLQVDPKQRPSAEEALAHQWLSSTAASGGVPQPLDTVVLDGLRAFTKGSKVKRSVLRALAPLASVDEVSRWADQFEALDEQGTGMVKVKDLAQSLAQHTKSPEEAEAISAALAESDDSEEVSYSAFLAACLCAHHSHLEEKQLRGLFDRLDKDGTGTITAEQLGQALGDVVDMESINVEFGSRPLTFTDFRWLLQRPQLAPSSMSGLRQLVGAFRGLGLEKNWRVDTVRARLEGENSIEAARRENAAWRRWHKQRLRREAGEEIAEDDDEEDSSDELLPESVQAQLPSMQTLPSESSSKGIDSRKCSGAESLSRGADSELAASSSPSVLPNEESNADLQTAWAVATAEAKEGELEARRRENLAWRKMNMQAGRQSSKGPSRSD